MHTVVETPSYLADAKRLLSATEQKAVVDRLATDPTCGVLLQGTGGVRKVRFGFGGRGKSGGARIVYLFGGGEVPIFILAVFAKNEKANLTAAERNALGKIVMGLLDDYKR